jgi:hypothetical protein
MTLFPFRGKARSGQHEMFKPSVRYAITHRVEVWGQREAVALADLLHGRFEASVAPSPFDTLAVGLYEVILVHRGVPDKSTVARARKAIEQAIEETKVRGRYLGFERAETGPAELPRRHHHDHDDDDSDLMGPPLPLRS